jgi:transposase
MSQPDVAVPIATTPLTRLSALEKRQLAARVKAVVGVDAGKFAHVLVIRPSGAADSRPVSCPVTPEGFAAACEAILRAASGACPSDILVGIEFAGAYGFTLAHYLHARGFLVTSVLAAHTKRWKEVMHRQALKTDAKDAAAICDLVAQGKFVGFAFLATPYAELRYLVSAREHVATLRNAAITRLTAVLDVVFPEFAQLFDDLAKPTALAVLRAFPGPAALLAASPRRVLRLLRKASLGHLKRDRYDALVAAARATLALPAAQGVLAQEIPLIVERIALSDAQLRLLKRRMIETMEPLPEAAALLTIPWVAPVTAATFLGCVGDPKAYASAGQVLKLAGLSLVERSSGITQGRRRLSKRGKPVLRKQAFMFALRGVRGDGLFRTEFERLLRNNGGKKLSALTAISRKAIRLLFTVARECRPYVPADEWAASGRRSARSDGATGDGTNLAAVSAQLGQQQRARQDRSNRRKREARKVRQARRCPAA